MTRRAEFTKPTKRDISVSCLHCGGKARLTDGREVYPHLPHLHERPFWKCDPCNATCGCHPGTTEPLGHPANKETRKARMHVHDKLDPMWKRLNGKRRRIARSVLYSHLSECMGLPPERTHTGMFTIEQCREAWKCLQKITPEWLSAKCH